jgi:hypothetical protein
MGRKGRARLAAPVEATVLLVKGTAGATLTVDGL